MARFMRAIHLLPSEMDRPNKSGDDGFGFELKVEPNIQIRRRVSDRA